MSLGSLCLCSRVLEPWPCICIYMYYYLWNNKNNRFLISLDSQHDISTFLSKKKPLAIEQKRVLSTGASNVPPKEKSRSLPCSLLNEGSLVNPTLFVPNRDKS